MNYLLDTNIVLVYAQNSAMTKRIEKDMQLFNGKNNLFISIVTVGEIESLMLQRQYGERKIKAFRKLLGTFAVIDINIREVISRYAEIDAYSQGRHPSKNLPFSARNMGKNDLWIAAISSYYELVLVSTDQDFNHLDNKYLTVKYIDIEQYRS